MLVFYYSSLFYLIKFWLRFFRLFFFCAFFYVNVTFVVNKDARISALNQVTFA